MERLDRAASRPIDTGEALATRRTVATYDEIAAAYREKWRDRTVMERALAAFVERVRSGGLVLDVGCGPGFDAALLQAEGLRAVALDLSRGMVMVGSQHYACSFVQADMRSLPLGASVADGLWVSASLLHLPPAEGKAALREFYRVLRPGAVMYLSVKEGTGAAWRQETLGRPAPRFFVYWEAPGLDRALGEAGFDVVEAWRDEGASTWLNRIVVK